MSRPFPARIAMLAGLCIAAAAAPAHAASPLPKLEIDRESVPLPTEVTYVGQCDFTRDGRGLLCLAELEGVEGRHVAAMRRDGSRFRCLTCTAGIPGGRRAHKAFGFPDGRRFLLGALPPAENNADEGASLVVFVGECAPSLLRCEEVALDPVALPGGTSSLNDREVRITPDGRKLAYTVVRPDGFVMLLGDLVDQGDSYEVRDARVLNPAPAPATAEEWSVRGAFSEIKSFPDARTMLYGSTVGQGSNLDVYRMDLVTGRSERLTFNGEWDEDADLHPRGKLLTVGSTRHNYNALRGATVVPLPPFLDSVKAVFFARFKLANLEERRRALEPWLTDLAGERAGRDGRQLSSQRGGWDGRMPVRWSPDGTRIVWTEVGPGTATRIAMAQLPEVRRTEPACLEPADEPACVTPTTDWAPPIAGYPVAGPGVHSIPGPGGGSATLTVGGIVIGGELRVDYDDYTSADGSLVLNGSESGSGIAFGQNRFDYDADVVAGGSESGSYRAGVFGIGRRACGTFEGKLGARSERTVFGWTDPECGFPAPPVCANRTDDDGDGLEDMTDPGCSREEDGSEAGPRIRNRCALRPLANVAVGSLRDGSLAVDVPGTAPIDVAVRRAGGRRDGIIVRQPDRLAPFSVSPRSLPPGRYSVRFRIGERTAQELAVLRGSRFRALETVGPRACAREG